MCALWVNLEVPINCVLLKHWNKYVFPFGVTLLNLEVAINCVILEHWNSIFFLFWGTCHVCFMGKFGSPHKL